MIKMQFKYRKDHLYKVCKNCEFSEKIRGRRNSYICSIKSNKGAESKVNGYAPCDEPYIPDTSEQIEMELPNE